MHLLDLFFPKRCVGCGSVGRYFCAHCRLRIRNIEPYETICPVCEKSAISGMTHPRCRTRYTIDGLTSFFHYSGVIQRAVKAIKYRYVSDMVGELVSHIQPIWIETIRMHKKSYTMLPIPLHPGRMRERGFNQAEIFGKALAAVLNMEINQSILIRRRFTTPQVEMKDRETRLKNMAGVFALNTRAGFVGNDVLLFDDVFTTGATLRSAAGVLKRAGARYVWGVTIAR